MLNRNEIEEKYKWNLKNYFASDEKWEEEYKDLCKIYNELEVFEGKLSDDDVLFECLEKSDKFGIRIGKLYVYASLKLKEDLSCSKYQNYCQKAEKLSVDEGTSTSFIASEIKEFSDEKLLKLSKNPKFKNYDLMFLNFIKDKKHMLSKAEEKLLAKMSEAGDNSEEVFDMFDSVDVKFEDVTNEKGEKLPLNNSNYGVYIHSTDAKLRETAFKNLHKAFGNINFMLSANYLSNVKSDCVGAKIRGFKSALSASIWAEDASEEVYNTLICQVNKNLPLFQRYFEIKRKVLKQNKFFNYDVNAQVFESNKTYSYETSFKIVKKTMAVLGKEYTSVLQKAKDERWIDVFPNKNKDTGAFSWGAYGANPVVMLNHENTERCLFTLAHELGHMMHTYFSNKNQPSQKAGYEIFVAEVASNVNEMLLVKNMLANAKTRQEKMYYYDYVLNMFYASVFRQTMFAEFEQFSHLQYESNEDCSAKAFDDFYLNLNKKYFGKMVEVCEDVKFEWSRIPHFYNSFYVYKYATGLISALCIVNKILENEKEEVPAYLKFLSSGSTKSPIELLKIANCNLEDENTFNSAFKFIEDILNEYEKCL